MATTIYVRLGETPEQRVSWLARGDVATPTSRNEPLGRVVEQSTAARVVVFAPAMPMVTLEAEVPPLGGQRLRQALPYALEEHFAEDVENLHIAHGTRSDSGNMPVVALADEQMAKWQQLFTSLEFRPHQMVNEVLALPWQEGEWSLLLEPHQALLRSGPHSGQSLPLEQLSALLVLAWNQREAGDSPTLRIYDARPDEEGFEVGIETQVEYEKVADPLRLLIQGMESAPLINLLQGEYSRKEQLGKYWRPWRLTAVLLAVWLVVQSVVAVWELFSLRSRDSELNTAIVQVYRDTFPQAKNLGTNLHLRMERKLDELRGGGGGKAFSHLLAGSGSVLASSKGLTVKSLRYKQGELELELDVEGLPVLDQLKSALQEKKLNVEVRSATARGDKVESRIVIKEAGA
jgi:general secretion pathway protein L